MERAELAADPAAEARELAAIDVGPGLTPELAQQVPARGRHGQRGIIPPLRPGAGYPLKTAARCHPLSPIHCVQPTFLPAS